MDAIFGGVRKPIPLADRMLSAHQGWTDTIKIDYAKQRKKLTKLYFIVTEFAFVLGSWSRNCFFL
jgi:hypothetical protein